MKTHRLLKTAILSLAATSCMLTPITSSAKAPNNVEEVFIDGNIVNVWTERPMEIIFTENTYEPYGVDFDYLESDISGYSKINTNADIILFPTGKFKDNTEVVVDNKYYLLNETKINGFSIIGDVNKDYKTSIVDLVRLQGYVMGRISLDVISKGRADMNRDGYVDSFDTVLMRKSLI